MNAKLALGTPLTYPDTKHSHHDTSSNLTDAERRPTDKVSENEPSNLTGGKAETPKAHAKDDNVQHAEEQGEDPSLEKQKGGKLTGSGVDGSHSAVFGLTPDGHKFDDTTKATTTVPETHDQEKKQESQGDVGSRDVGSGKVAEQLHDPKITEKGHGGESESTSADNSKPGHGLNTDNIV